MTAEKIKRWYQKNEYLNAFMNLMQDLTIEQQCEIATDIIIKASSMLDREYENVIKEIATYNPKDYKRWYDINPNLHLAIESLRDLDDSQKEQIVKELIDEVLKNHIIDDGIEMLEINSEPELEIQDCELDFE